jgi:uncharacterized protein YaiI (UPF0178 family)
VTIWVDADAAPARAKDLVFRASARLRIPTVLVANRPVRVPDGLPLVSAVRVAGSVDAADAYIAERAEPGDLVITADVPLAAKVVARGAAAIDPRGTQFTEDNVADRLSVRDLMDHVRGLGETTGGPPPYDARASQAFAAALDRVLVKLHKRSGSGS